MAVVVQEVTAEIPDVAPRPAQPQAPAGAPAEQAAVFDPLRAALLRDAQRQARLWAD